MIFWWRTQVLYLIIFLKLYIWFLEEKLKFFIWWDSPLRSDIPLHHISIFINIHINNKMSCFKEIDFFTVSKLIKAWLWGNLVTTFTQHQFWPSGIVIACICLSICVCRHQSHHNLSPVQARITRFEPEVQNTLVKIPIVLWVIDIYLQGQI